MRLLTQKEAKAAHRSDENREKRERAEYTSATDRLIADYYRTKREMEEQTSQMRAWADKEIKQDRDKVQTLRSELASLVQERKKQLVPVTEMLKEAERQRKEAIQQKELVDRIRDSLNVDTRRLENVRSELDKAVRAAELQKMALAGQQRLIDENLEAIQNDRNKLQGEREKWKGKHDLALEKVVEEREEVARLKLALEVTEREYRKKETNLRKQQESINSQRATLTNAFEEARKKKIL